MSSSSVSAAAVPAAPLSPASGSVTKAGAIAKAAHQLLLHLERGQRIEAPVLRTAMDKAFGASDADGGWNWKMAYDACEAATVLFLRKFGPAMRARAASPSAMLPMLAKIGSLLPTHTRRSEESEALQQFSTPIMLALAASVAATIRPGDIVLEPSAGTGLLAILAELSGASLVLNELAEARAELLSLLYPGNAVTRLQTDAGERIIGRKVSSAWVTSALLGKQPTLPPENAFAALLEGRTVLDLAEGLRLRRARVMGAHRIELCNFTDTMRDRLRAYGLFSEIISWKLRMFVPTDASGVSILAKVLEIYPIERIGEREAA